MRVPKLHDDQVAINIPSNMLLDSEKVFFLRKLEKEFVWAQHNKGKGDNKFPSFGKSSIYGLVVVSFLGDDMSYQR